MGRVRSPEDLAELSEAEDDGQPRRHQERPPASAREELGGSRVAQVERPRDLGQGTELHGGLPERLPVANAQLLEYGREQLAIFNALDRISARIRGGSEGNQGRPESLTPPQQIDAIVASDRGQPAPSLRTTRRLEERGRCPQEDLVHRIGGVLAAIQQPPAEVEDRSGIRLVELREPSTPRVAEVESHRREAC